MEAVAFVSREIHNVRKKETDYGFTDYRYVDFAKGVIGVQTVEMKTIEEAPLSAEAREKFQHVLSKVSLESIQEPAERDFVMDLPRVRFKFRFNTQLSMEISKHGMSGCLWEIFDCAEFQKLAGPILYKARMRLFGP